MARGHIDCQRLSEMVYAPRPREYSRDGDYAAALPPPLALTCLVRYLNVTEHLHRLLSAEQEVTALRHYHYALH